MIINDRQITISAAGSRTAAHWSSQSWLLSDLWQRLATPARSTEPLAEYLALPKGKQDNLKDVGGFVGGALRDGRRKGNAVLGRDIIALDLDRIPAGGADEVLRRVDALCCGYCIYSTRKYSPAAPRLRVLLPLDRTATSDEYEPISRRMAAYIGIEMADPSTFEACRLMYWPSCCADGEYIHQWADKPLLSVDGLLVTYMDWRDATAWPQVPGAEDAGRRLVAKQADPEGKEGIVGSFCRVYSIYRTMDELLPGVYEPVDTAPDRYTFTGGSTTGGAVIYDSGKFLFSHHATDPAGGKLCNAFDLVRLHLYGDKDDEAKPGTPANRLPSFEAMCRMAEHLPDVSALIAREIYARATSDFGEAPTEGEDAANWMQQLVTHDGRVEKTTNNILIILENDPLLKGRMALDIFANRGLALGALPWDKQKKRRVWNDNDDAGVRWYLEKVYNLTGKEKVLDALSMCGNNHAVDPVRDYLEGLCWDGVGRLDRLLTDYLGAADVAYTRAVSRKAFTAAVARALEPGCKYDTMTILSGPQGIGKSTLLRKMGLRWFSDSLTTFSGKEARELVQGVWIVEVGELAALSKGENEQVKQFLSQSEDIFRVAYGRRTNPYPRRCVFFGTSNGTEYLRDKTGNRRFWPVDLCAVPITKSVFTDLDAEVDQLWAEAVTRYRLGEKLYLTGEAASTALEEQEGHREHSPREGMVQDFVNRQVPCDWNRWTLDRRRMFWGGAVSDEMQLVQRERVCALEVWVEALNGDPRFMKYGDAAEINGIVAAMDGWRRTKNGVRCGYCGLQKAFEKVLL